MARPWRRQSREWRRDYLGNTWLGQFTFIETILKTEHLFGENPSKEGGGGSRKGSVESLPQVPASLLKPEASSETT